MADVVRARDAWLPELGGAGAPGRVHAIASYKGLVDDTPWLAQGAGDNIRLTAAGWYAVVVCAPLSSFSWAQGSAK